MQYTKRILVVEDDIKISAFLEKGLKEENYTVDCCYDGEEAFYLITTNKYDLIILDLMIPYIDGVTLCNDLRKIGNNTIIISSARSDLLDKVTTLQMGADDYLPKPYDPRELEARIHSVLRRYKAKLEAKEESKSDFKCDKDTMSITYKGRNIDLTNAEFGILSYMISKQGLVVSREDLIHNVNAINEDSSNKSIDVMVGRIRNKLGDKSLIESVRGVGYKLLK